MFRNKDIVYFTLFPWDHAYSSVSLSLTRKFAKNNRIFYINHPFTYKDFLSRYSEPAVQRRKKALWANKHSYEQIPGLPDHVVGVHPPNTWPINWLPPGKMYNQVHKLNRRKILKTIKNVIEDYQLKDFIFLNCFNPYYVGALPREYGARLSIYQCIDDMREESYTAKHGARLEDEVIRQADIALVTSTNLHKLKSPLNPNTAILHNAMDWNIFKAATEEKWERPAELKGFTGKVIGFTGNMNEYRVDYQLIKKVAIHHWDKKILLVGPLSTDDYKMHGLDRIPNIIFTGGKDIKDLPQYLQYMDCCIIPFLCNKLTESVYPLKINEYLSAGKPVVSTPFSADIRSFQDHIYLSKDEEEFPHLIDKALLENNDFKKSARVQKAKTNTWEARVDEFWDIVEAWEANKKLPKKINNNHYELAST